MRTFTIIGVALALAVNVGFLWWVAHPKWAPLGPFPVQLVGLPLLDHPALTAPEAISSGSASFPTLTVRGDEWGDIPVTGEKCSSETVQVRGTIVWQAVEPPGSCVTVASGGLATRVIGCTKFSFRNPVPDGVKQRVRDLAKTGVTESVWRITGTETPFDAAGNPGVEQPWNTQNFLIEVR